MEKYHAITEISWKKSDQIQHKLNLRQSVYAMNIRFDGVDGLWSVMLILEDLKGEEVQSKKPQVVKIGFLFPETIKEFLNIGMHFVVSEGPSVIIGTGKILAIENK